MLEFLLHDFSSFHVAITEQLFSAVLTTFAVTKTVVEKKWSTFFNTEICSAILQEVALNHKLLTYALPKSDIFALNSLLDPVI